MAPSPQGVYWIVTLSVMDASAASFTPRRLFTENDCVLWVYGQEEVGEGGFNHYQFVFSLESKMRLPAVKKLFGSCNPHLELTRSKHADAYCRKEETKVPESEFEYGSRAKKVNSKTDWDREFELAKYRDFEAMDPGVKLRCWSSCMKIAAYYDEPLHRKDVATKVFWGVTGSGKSWKVFNDILVDQKYYVKSPTTKWWDGYKGEDNVVIDEFRGEIGISHLLKWLDHYPCTVEIKGGQVPLKATKFYIMSNLDPRNWYLDIDAETKDALLRRLSIVHFDIPFEAWKPTNMRDRLGRSEFESMLEEFNM